MVEALVPEFKGQILAFDCSICVIFARQRTYMAFIDRKGEGDALPFLLQFTRCLSSYSRTFRFSDGFMFDVFVVCHQDLLTGLDKGSMT